MTVYEVKHGEGLKCTDYFSDLYSVMHCIGEGWAKEVFCVRALCIPSDDWLRFYMDRDSYPLYEDYLEIIKKEKETEK